MRWILARICLCLAAMMATLPAEAAPRPFQLRDGQVVITVNLNGKDLPALLDTGATKSLIDAAFAKELGIRSQRIDGGTVGASGQQIRFGMTRDLKLDIGTGPRRLRLGTYESDHAFAPEGVHVLIGMDVLNNLAVSLDFQKMTVEIERTTELKPPVGEPFAMKRRRYLRPTLSVTLGDTDVDLLLDTAASSALHLQTRIVADSPDLSALPRTRRMVSGIDGNHEQDAITIPVVRLGGQRFTDVRATVADMVLHWFFDMDGVVGVALMKRFHIVFDFQKDRVWMTPVAD